MIQSSCICPLKVAVLSALHSGINDSVDNRTLTAWQNPKGDIITDQYERFKMRLGRYLKIRRVKLTDEGKYVCIAYNHFGKVKEEIQLVVQG